jgi:cytoskeletal protein CcmA (bactofilin family)
MFEIGKKGTPEAGPRPESSSARTESSPPRGSSAPTGRDAAVIGPSIHIDGDVRGEEDLLIEGEVGGTVQLKNNSLTIGPNGKVRADVYAHSIYVDGYVEGDLFGAERVHIRKSAQVKGNVTSPRVSVEDGAKFKGAPRDGPASRAECRQPSSAPRNAAPQRHRPSRSCSRSRRSPSSQPLRKREPRAK